MPEFAVPDISDLPPPPRPEALLGVASPLWAYYVGAAATGVAWWWMTRWTQAGSLDALFGSASAAPQAAGEVRSFAPPADTVLQPLQSPVEAAQVSLEAARSFGEPVMQGAQEAVEAFTAVTTTAADQAIETASTAIEAAAPVEPEPVAPAEPIGGESAPIAPIVAATALEPTQTREPRARLRPTPPAEPSAAPPSEPASGEG